MRTARFLIATGHEIAFVHTCSSHVCCILLRMPRTPQLGLAVNMGGDDRTSAAKLGT